MLELIIFLLSTIGATLITTQSYLFKSTREKINKINPKLGKLVKCPQCSGFYWGIIIQFIILIHQRNSFIFYFTDLYYIIYGFIGSFVCYLIYLLIKGLIDKYD
ncbi:hypothetical protein M0Q97_08445 [Candidatus Dojkabacteria bacterium]|jgi:hypothetical protein|nr:hypothetical protein [Candidatus Dojkabacteria bacterium]